ncbi:PHP domain-containing protein, partial [Streptomyces sp. NPDC006251]|uniref:PHP domain-containing protein n=1 Tax=Streptomyces sp. NPDC006251 TaxID=3155718 RepID=UPI0033BDA11F
MPGFTHLHTVSGFSLRYGASHPERLAERASERGMDALALTDRDTLAGAVRFAKACGKAGVRPLFGADLAVTGAEPPGAAGRQGRRRTPVRGGAFVDESAPRVIFLARDGARGWAGLCRLVSAAHEGEGTPLLPWDRNHAEGLTVLLGPDSDVGRALAAGRPDRAARLLVPWREVYGDDLRLEAVWHGRKGTGPGSLRLAARTVGFAAEQRIRPVLTNAVRYADSGLGPVADVLDAARRLVPIDPTKELDSGEAWLKGPGAMVQAAERIVEAAGFRRGTAHRLVEQTEATAAACLVDPEDDLGIGTVHFPEPHLVGAGRRTAQRTLASRAAAGMVLRGYDRRREYWERMHHELDIIAHHGFASYFLTVAQVVDDVREMGIRVAARGSGAGSLVNHLLGIAHADPIEHRLLMERFLSKERVVLPDIDIDVESARRLEVYRAIIGRFGTERVATVAMPETYRVRHAIRDVGAALSMDPAEIDRVAKSFPHIRARDARAALEELPELRALAGEKEKYGRLWELVEALDALPRGVAMHPCGVLLSDASLLARTPVMPTSGEGFPMSQFDKDDVEDLGLLKLDVLGVRMQSAMAHAVAEVERVSGERVDLDALPPGDPETYRLIRSTETLGCFQIESPGQRDLVGRLQPAGFHDLVVDISLFRPGPILRPHSLCPALVVSRCSDNATRVESQRSMSLLGAARLRRTSTSSSTRSESGCCRVSGRRGSRRVCTANARATRARVRSWGRTWLEILRAAKQCLEFVERYGSPSPRLPRKLLAVRLRSGQHRFSRRTMSKPVSRRRYWRTRVINCRQFPVEPNLPVTVCDPQQRIGS